MRSRLRLLFVFFLFCFSIIFLRLFYWQIINHKNLLALALQQYSSVQVISSERGKIVSSDGFSLVLNKKNLTLIANPNQLKEPLGVLANKLNEFSENVKNIDLLQNKSLYWVSLIKDFDEKKVDDFKKLNLSGLSFEEGEKRYYSEASMAAQLIGFVGEDDKGNKKGYFGLEGYYDEELKGISGKRYFEKDALGRPIPLAKETEEKPVPGRDLILNLNRRLQYLAEQKLALGIEKYGANSGSVVVMDPKSGAILAMASLPKYDPGNYSIYNQDLYRNPVISSSFEPGSVIKPIIIASALDSGVIKEDDICTQCNGPRTIYDYTIKTWNDKYYPNSSMTDIIVHSDNVGMVFISEKLGASRIYSYLKNFGFSEKTGIDLQGELSPELREKGSWREIDLATASFGQGIATTPIQILLGVSAIANGGALLRPRMVREVVEGDKIIQNPLVQKRRVISKKASEIVTRMMIEAVERGEAKFAKPKGYTIAGKTGTAQIPIAGHYDPNRTIASFVGFAPVTEPKFSMLVILNEPQKSSWGSETAAPLWFDIAGDIFKIMDIKPGQ